MVIAVFAVFTLFADLFVGEVRGRAGPYAEAIKPDGLLSASTSLGN
jgi:hypothetical protein